MGFSELGLGLPYLYYPLKHSSTHSSLHLGFNHRLLTLSSFLWLISFLLGEVHRLGFLVLLHFYFESSLLLDRYLHSFHKFGDDAQPHDVLDVVVSPHLVVMAAALVRASCGDSL